jgi:hypothetical protein
MSKFVILSDIKHPRQDEVTVRKATEEGVSEEDQIKGSSEGGEQQKRPKAHRPQLQRLFFLLDSPRNGIADSPRHGTAS